MTGFSGKDITDSKSGAQAKANLMKLMMGIKEVN